ncbi:MAG: hypothetical protein WBG11_07965 [Methylocella sp.]
MRDAVTDKTVWWNNNKAMTAQAFDTLYADMLAHAKGLGFTRKTFMAAPGRAPPMGPFCILVH